MGPGASSGGSRGLPTGGARLPRVPPLLGRWALALPCDTPPGPCQAARAAPPTPSSFLPRAPQPCLGTMGQGQESPGSLLLPCAGTSGFNSLWAALSVLTPGVLRPHHPDGHHPLPPHGLPRCPRCALVSRLPWALTDASWGLSSWPPSPCCLSWLLGGAAGSSWLLADCGTLVGLEGWVPVGTVCRTDSRPRLGASPSSSSAPGHSAGHG